MIRIFQLLSLVAIAMMFAACSGGGGDDSTPPDQTPPGNSDPGTKDPANPPGNGGDVDEEPADPVAETKIAIERMLGAVYFFERLNDSRVLEVPSMPGVADQIELELPRRPDGLEGVRPYDVYLPAPEYGKVSVVFWQDGNQDGEYNPEPVSEPDAVTFISNGALGVAASVGVANQMVDGHPMTIAAMGGLDGQGVEGAQVEPTEDLQLSGIIMRRELEDGRVRIGDDDLRPSPARYITLRVKNAQNEWELLDLKLRVDLKVGEGNGTEATIDWLVDPVNRPRLIDFFYVDTDRDGRITREEAAAEKNLDFDAADTDGNGYVDDFEYEAAKEAYFLANGGLKESLVTTSPLEFRLVNNEAELREGSAVYAREQNGKTVRIQVSVDPDPAFLLIDIDADGDEMFEMTERIPQSEIRFILP